jgi:hypothetical protein
VLFLETRRLEVTSARVVNDKQWLPGWPPLSIYNARVNNASNWLVGHTCQLSTYQTNYSTILTFSNFHHLNSKGPLVSTTEVNEND